MLLAPTGQEAGTVWLRDHFQFSDGTHEIEEAFIRWLECEVDDVTARIHGLRHVLELTIEQPQGLSFHLENLEEESKANRKPDVLKRLSFVMAGVREVDALVRMVVRKANSGSASAHPPCVPYVRPQRAHTIPIFQ